MADTAAVPKEEARSQEAPAEESKADTQEAGQAAAAASEESAGGASEAPAGGGLQPEPEESEPEPEAPSPPRPVEKKRPKPKASAGRGGGGGGPKKKPRKSDEQSGATKLHRFDPGNAVLGRYPDGRWYPATVRELRADGRYLVDWDDGDISNRVKDDDDLDELPEDEY